MGAFENTFGGILGSQGSLSNPSLLLNKMDLWSNGLNGVDLINEVGTGGKLVDLPCIELIATNDRITATDASFTMFENGIYEYYVEFTLSALPVGPEYIIYNGNLAVTDNGFDVRIYGAGFYSQVCDGTARFTVDQRAGTYFVVGLNTVKLTFNTSAKTIEYNINGTIYNATHTLAGTILGKVTNAIFLGRTPSAAVKAKFIYFKTTKNSVVTHEYVFGSIFTQGIIAGNYNKDLVGGVDIRIITVASNPISTQNYRNPYRNGYDLYWNETALRYGAPVAINCNGISANADADALIKRVSINEIGYHIISYIQLPDLPIFNTTNRTYWKNSIESDPYYVGNTAGKERYFHKTWLNCDWINSHIQDAYTGFFFVRLNKYNAVGQYAVTVTINDIILFKQAISFYSHKKDINHSTDRGTLYMSKNIYNDHSLMHSRGNKTITLSGNFLYYSENYGVSFIRSFDISTLYPPANISAIRILSNGNIIIFSKNTFIHYSDDNLATLKVPTLLNSAGGAFSYHTPVNVSYPGGYWRIFNGFAENNNVLVFGNYANSNEGASPILVWYSINNGATWKVIYEFGQNPNFTDDGTEDGGTGGNLLGSASNPLIARHIHSVQVGFDGNFYVCTGDNVSEQHFLKCVYNSSLDTWTITDLLNATSSTWQRMRAIGLYEKDGYLYWGSDGGSTFVFNDVTYNSYGIYKCLVADVNNPGAHILLKELTLPCYTFLNDISTNEIIAGLDSGDKFYTSSDYGNTWTEHTNKFTTNFYKTWYNSTTGNWVTIFKWIIELLD
ncbi:MAG TPA: hypothetical protein VK153_00445 [Candidatus Paceibacterota bacterium]|nr:hypothetical protein [Candidatus Paceibacterota bacterium]